MEYEKPSWMRPWVQIDDQFVRIELWRLLVIFAAAKTLSQIEDDELRAPLSEMDNEFCPYEAQRILVQTAVMLRMMDDKCEGEILKDKVCGELYAENRLEPLTLREACNKIIHAKQLHFDVDVVDQFDQSRNSLNPSVYLYGEKGGATWKCCIDVLRYIRGGHIALSGAT